MPFCGYWQNPRKLLGGSGRGGGVTAEPLFVSEEHLADSLLRGAAKCYTDFHLGPRFLFMSVTVVF